MCPLQATASAAVWSQTKLVELSVQQRSDPELQPMAAVPGAASRLGVSCAAEVGAGQEDETGKVNVVGNTQDEETGQMEDGKLVVQIQNNNNGLTIEQAVVGDGCEEKTGEQQVKHVRRRQVTWVRQVGLRE